MVYNYTIMAPRNRRYKKGFTLIELLVVISIVGLLSSVVLASLNSARMKGRDAKRKADLRQIALANELYYDGDGNGNYIGLTGYFGNTTQFGGGNPSFNSLIPKYASSLPKDPMYGGTINGYRADYSYLTKDWTGCANAQTGYAPDRQKYAFYAILEKPSAADLATMSDAFDICNKTGWGFNYRVGN